MVGIFLSVAAIVRLVGAVPLEQNDEWVVQRGRYITLRTIAPLSDDPAVSFPANAVWPIRPEPANVVTLTQLHHAKQRRVATFAKG